MDNVTLTVQKSMPADDNSLAVLSCRAAFDNTQRNGFYI